MGLLDWLVGREKGNHEDLVVGEDEKISSLSLNSAIATHRKWATRLNDYVNGNSSEVLDSREVGADNNCILGKWIHDEGKRNYSNLSEWHELLMVHAQFHRCAGDIIHHVDQKNLTEARKLLSDEFKNHSVKIQLALARLYKCTT